MHSPPEDLVLDEINTPERVRQFSDLLDRAFGVPNSAHFLDDFPVWNSPSVRRLGLFQGPTLVSSVAIRIASLKTPSATTIPVAIIGAVTTDENWRGHGLASKSVAAAVDWSKQQGAAMVLLWGSEHSLYQKLGFELCGEQARVPLAALNALGGTDTVHEGWCPGLFKCLQNRKEGLALQTSDLAWMSKHKNVKWYWTGNAEQPSAYAGMGRGIDLQGIVHEWGGEREKLRAVLAKIYTTTPEAMLLGSPALLSEYGFASDQMIVEYLGLVKILDPMRIFLAYHQNLGVSSGFSALQDLDGQKWRLSITGKAPLSVSDCEVVQLFFGPLPPDSKNLLAPYLPLPLWIWGLDAA